MSTVKEKDADFLVYRTDVMIGAYGVAVLLLGVLALRNGTSNLIEFATSRPLDLLGVVLMPRLFAVSVEQFKNRLYGAPMYVKDIKWLSDNVTYNLYTVLYPAFILLCLLIVWQAISGQS